MDMAIDAREQRGMAIAQQENQIKRIDDNTYTSSLSLTMVNIASLRFVENGYANAQTTSIATSNASTSTR